MTVFRTLIRLNLGRTRYAKVMAKLEVDLQNEIQRIGMTQAMLPKPPKSSSAEDKKLAKAKRQAKKEAEGKGH